MSVNQPPPEWVVVDASFVLRYVLHTQAKKPHAAGLQRLQPVRLIVPALWNSEIASALVQAERRGAATPAGKSAVRSAELRLAAASMYR